MRGGWLSTAVLFLAALLCGLACLGVFALVGNLADPWLLGIGMTLALTVALALAGWLAHRKFQGTLATVSQTLAALRADPGQNLHLERLTQQDAQSRELASELDLLAQRNQKLNQDLIAAHEKLEAFQREAMANSDSAIGESSIFNAPPGSRYVVGSSRQRMVARLTPGLQWLGATPVLLRFLGCTGRDLVSRSFLDFVSPEDTLALKRVLEEAVQDGEGHNIVFQVFGHGSETPEVRELRYVQLDVMTCYSDKGVPQHLRCHLLDITEKVRTEAELRRRTQELSEANARLRQINHDLQRLKESYRDLYHNAPVLYFSLDVDGRFVAINESMLRTLGYTREELMGQPYTTLLQGEDCALFLENPTLFQHPGEIEARWVKRDGSVIDVWIGTTTIKDSRGLFVRSRSAARDMSERNRLEQALQTKAEEIVRANTRLRQINQELEDFTYVVSHDLKEPLRTLEAFSNFLALDYAHVLQGDGQEYINHLIQASKRLARLIDDLLTLSRVGRFMKKPVALDWDGIVNTVLSDLHELIQRRQAVVQVEKGLPPTLGDPERIGQLFTNLISNAIKYNNSSRPEVRVGTRGETPEGEIILFVQDNGIGISPEYHEQIFRIFRRLHHREEFEGTGAGLAICKKIVEGHGGRIWVESTPGEGSTFVFTLPTIPVERDRPPANGSLGNGHNGNANGTSNGNSNGNAAQRALTDIAG